MSFALISVQQISKKKYKQYTCTWYGHYYTGILVQHWLHLAPKYRTLVFLIFVILSPRFSMDNY